MIIKRRISNETLKLSNQFPVITITGPRQSGKTTLAQMLFHEKAYVNLEDLEQRDYAVQDPKGFLEQFPEGAVIDEIQRAPDLTSYIQVIVDKTKNNGMFILTGSHQFEMMHKVSQSLAGRTAVIRLLPFDLNEAYQNTNADLLSIMYTGFYPRIFSEKIDPEKYYSFYVSTYLERDLNQIINIKNLSLFETFLRLCAGRTGQLLNYTSLSNACGVDQKTLKSWISVLEASYIIKVIRPYYRNLNKRLVKAPKIYFYDTGLLCYLIGIKKPEHLGSHPLTGNIFENFIVSELIKNRFNRIETENLLFFRDHSENEVDVVFDNVVDIDLLEIKLSKTINSNFFNIFKYFKNLNVNVKKSILVYGGEESYTRENIDVKSWKDVGKL
jgi:uncharacterized protein